MAGFIPFIKSYGSNHIQFFTGHLIQWGKVVNGGTTVNVTFPFSFSSSAFVFSNQDTPTTSLGGDVCYKSLLLTGVTFEKNGSSDNICWLAIGV